MPDDKPGDHGDQKQLKSSEAAALKSPDAQEARNASGGEIKTIEKGRTNASDGSLRRFSGIDLDAQNESIEIDFGDRVVSRKSAEAKLNSTGTESRNIEPPQPTRPEPVKPVFEVQPVVKAPLPEELMAVALPLDPTVPPVELTAVALPLNPETRPVELTAVALPLETSKPLVGGIHKEELQSRDKGMGMAPSGPAPVPHVRQEQVPENARHVTHAELSVSAKIIAHPPGDANQIPANQFDANQIDANKRGQESRTLLHGSVEKNVELLPEQSKILNSPEGWQKVGQQLAALPLEQQLQVISHAATAAGDQARVEVITGTIGAMIGPVEATGHFLEHLGAMSDFAAAVIRNDRAASAAYGDKLGTSLTLATLHCSDFLFSAGDYVNSVGHSSNHGDHLKIFRDADSVMNHMNQAWSELPVKEQSRILSGLAVELYMEKALPQPVPEPLEKPHGFWGKIKMIMGGLKEAKEARERGHNLATEVETTHKSLGHQSSQHQFSQHESSPPESASPESSGIHPQSRRLAIAIRNAFMPVIEHMQQKPELIAQLEQN